MQKTCTNSACRRKFSVLRTGQTESVPYCPYCGKAYPNLRCNMKKTKREETRDQQSWKAPETACGIQSSELQDSSSDDIYLISDDQDEASEMIQARQAPVREATIFEDRSNSYQWIRDKVTKSLETVTIEEIDLRVRSFNCLKRANINTLADLIQKTPEDLIRIRNLGRKGVEEIENIVREIGLYLADREETEVQNVSADD